MAKKIATTNNAGRRIRFIDGDGSLVMNRQVSDYWWDSYCNDASFLNVSVSSSAKEHGVRVIREARRDANTIEFLVEYLSKR